MSGECALPIAHDADARSCGFDGRDHFLALLAAAVGGHHGLRQTAAVLAPNDGPYASSAVRLRPARRWQRRRARAQRHCSKQVANAPAVIFILLLCTNLFVRTPIDRLLNPPPRTKPPPSAQLILFIPNGKYRERKYRAGQ